MSLADGVWQAEELSDDALVVRVLQDCDVCSLAHSLVASKAAAARVLSRGQLTCEGRMLGAQEAVCAGDLVRLSFHREKAARQDDVEPVEVVYEDPLILVVDKPAGLLVHGDGTGARTLTECVRGHLAQRGSSACPQAVQRLDVDTSGLTLLSLTEEFQPALDAQVAGHDMHKRYLAVVDGRLRAAEEGWLELTGPIARDRHDARRMRVGASGKPARTRVRVLDRQGRLTLLLVELVTGRKHQIRVHLAHAGHPIVGDALYGGRSHPEGLMLHAWQERVVHPVTGMVIPLQTAWPERFGHLFNEPR